jgi:hypothetical protein
MPMPNSENEVGASVYTFRYSMDLPKSSKCDANILPNPIQYTRRIIVQQSPTNISCPSLCSPITTVERGGNIIGVTGQANRWD